MGLLNRFRKKQSDGDFRQPENAVQPADQPTMHDKVGDINIEGGVVDVESMGGKSSSPQKMILGGVALLGTGLAIAFMMMWVNRTPTEPPAEEKKPEVSNGRQYDFAAEQAKIKRELDAQQEAEVEASAPEGITPDVASTPSVASPVQSAKSGASKHSSSPVSTFIAMTVAMALSRLMRTLPLDFPVPFAANNWLSTPFFALLAVTFRSESEAEDALGIAPCGIADGCKAGKSLVMGMC